MASALHRYNIQLFHGCPVVKSLHLKVMVSVLMVFIFRQGHDYIKWQFKIVARNEL